MEFLNSLDPIVKLIIMVGGVVLIVITLTVGKRR